MTSRNGGAELPEVTIDGGALVLASVASPAELDLLTDWLRTQRAAHPGADIEVVQLPADEPPPGVLAELVEQLETGDDREVVPVRVFWVPGGLRCCRFRL